LKGRDDEKPWPVLWGRMETIFALATLPVLGSGKAQVMLVVLVSLFGALVVLAVVIVLVALLIKSIRL